MDYSVFTYKGNSRDLKRIITTLLKSGNAKQIKKLNYVHNYSMQGKKIDKIEEKIILIYSENKDLLMKFLSQNFPQIEKIDIN